MGIGTVIGHLFGGKDNEQCGAVPEPHPLESRLVPESLRATQHSAFPWARGADHAIYAFCMVAGQYPYEVVVSHLSVELRDMIKERAHLRLGEGTHILHYKRDTGGRI